MNKVDDFKIQFWFGHGQILEKQIWEELILIFKKNVAFLGVLGFHTKR